MVRTMSIIAVVSLAGAAASAGVMVDNPVALTATSDVSVRFVSSDAGAKGSLYFLGHELNEVITYAASSDAHNLGSFLFSNHGTSAGTTVHLGTFDNGAILHFAYLITNGVSVAPTGTLIRSDLIGDLAYLSGASMFNFDDGPFVRIGLEDIKNPHKSDWDHNDVIFDVIAAPVPAPGTIALATIALAVATPRRREKA